jgi:DNA-binding Lrp family transcriptional regulator
MLIGNVDREILELFSEDIAAYYSINEVAKRLGKKYPYINKRVSSLISQGILRKSVLGNTYLCSANLASDSAIALLSLVEVARRDAAAAKNPSLRRLLEEMKAGERDSNLICAVLNGNRLISVGNGRLPSLKLKGFSSISVSREVFLKMLLSEDIVEEHIIIFGFEKYFEMVGGVEKELRARQIRELT